MPQEIELDMKFVEMPEQEYLDLLEWVFETAERLKEEQSNH